MGRYVEYDESLNRLVLAETTAGSSETWGLAFGFDGFGNKVSQSVTKGSGPVWSQTVSTATNRVDAYTYDLNGNVTAMPGKTMTWDVLNRMESVTVSGGSESYDYAPSGLKVRWERVEGSGTTERYVFYGAGGERMEEFAANVNGSALQFVSTGRDVRFAGRLIYQKGEQVFTDRLGSVVLRRESGSWKRLSSYPYGEVKGAAPAGDRTGFATYQRSGLTGLDYARQRWYSNSGGAFLSADPYVASAGPADPGSWNRYAYVQGDPVNWGDPEGLERTAVHEGLFGGKLSCRYEYNEGALSDVRCIFVNLLNRFKRQSIELDEVPLDCWQTEHRLVSKGVEYTFLLAGVVPGVGEVSSVAESLLHAAEGDACSAVVSLAGAVPIGGRGFRLAKNFRRALRILTGLSGEGQHAHHVFSKAFQVHWERMGIDWNNAANGVWWEVRDHLSNARAYNADWSAWLEEHPSATADEAYAYAEKLAKDYGFEWKP